MGDYSRLAELFPDLCLSAGFKKAAMVVVERPGLEPSFFEVVFPNDKVTTELRQAQVNGLCALVYLDSSPDRKPVGNLAGPFTQGAIQLKEGLALSVFLGNGYPASFNKFFAHLMSMNLQQEKWIIQNTWF